MQIFELENKEQLPHDSELSTGELADHVHRRSPRDEPATGNKTYTCCCDISSRLPGEVQNFVTMPPVLTEIYDFVTFCSEFAHPHDRREAEPAFDIGSVPHVVVTQGHGLYMIEVHVPSRTTW